MFPTTEATPLFQSQLDAVRRSIADRERLLLELMLHRALLRRIGKEPVNDQSLNALEIELADLRAEQEFAEQRVMFARRRRRPGLGLGRRLYER